MGGRRPMGNRNILIIRGGAGAMPSGGTEWLALRRRDRRYDGKFVYAAVTTGIYCRPSCPARIPHRRNTLIFLAAPDAERQGYVPCRRCHPQSLLTPAERRITAALEYIEAHLDQPITLETLSQISGRARITSASCSRGLWGCRPNYSAMRGASRASSSFCGRANRSAGRAIRLDSGRAGRCMRRRTAVWE